MFGWAQDGTEFGLEVKYPPRYSDEGSPEGGMGSEVDEGIQGEDKDGEKVAGEEEVGVDNKVVGFTPYVSPAHFRRGM